MKPQSRSVLAYLRAHPEVLTRFWAKVAKSDGCWEWTGARNRKGYGSFRVNRTTVSMTHHLAWELHNGYRPTGMHVLHHCDHPSCVNPAHLWIGTNRDNVLDSIAKGRHKRPRHNSRLPESVVLEVRRRSDGGSTTRELADEFGLRRALIYRIAHRQTWAWL